MLKTEDTIGELIREFVFCRKGIADLHRQILELERRRDASSCELQKLLVSSGHKEAIHDGLRFFIHNGLQIESYIGIVVSQPQQQPPIEDQKE